MENGSAVADDDRHSILGDAKHKILGQMKNQFNSSSVGGASSSENDLLIDEEEDTTDTDSTEKPDKTVKELVKPESEKSTDESESTEEVKPPIILSFRKQAKGTKSKMTTRSAIHRGVEIEKKSSEHDSESEGLKRSTRRRSKDCNESVLQSAIARKEKSYNESSKPQRLTRQLKPTQKILDNIAAAAKDKSPPKKEKKRKTIAENTRKRKSDASSEYAESKCRRSGRLTQNSVTNNSESDSDTKPHEEINGVEEEQDFTSHLDADSVTAQLIASRLCVCTSPTKYTPLSESSK